jgi:hypothetical protein
MMAVAIGTTLPRAAIAGRTQPACSVSMVQPREAKNAKGKAQKAVSVRDGA